MKEKLPAFLLCLCLLAQLAACGQPAAQGTDPLPSETSAPTESTSPVPTPETTPEPSFVPDFSDVPADVLAPAEDYIRQDLSEYNRFLAEDSSIESQDGFDDWQITALSQHTDSELASLNVELWRMSFVLHPASEDLAAELADLGFFFTDDGWLIRADTGSICLFFLTDAAGNRTHLRTVNAGGAVQSKDDWERFLNEVLTDAGLLSTRPYPEEGTVPLSDILDEEQIMLFEQAKELFLLLFGGETEKIDSMPGWEYDPETDPTEWEYNGWTYHAVRGHYADWEIFIADIRAVSTDRWWAERNERGGPEHPTYIQHDGYTYHLHASMGGGGHNNNFPDTYRLDERTEDSISFTIIGHYSDFHPQEGETEEERDMRVATTYDYTLEFPIRLVLTEDGWRFDKYYVPIDVTDMNWMEFYDTLAAQ